MADSTSNIDTISSAQAQKEVTANAALNSASNAMFGANRATTTAALTWGYYGGRWRGTTVANGTLTLTASTTNYIVARRIDGAITTSTTTTNWNDRAQYIRLYSVVTSSTAISSYSDFRQLLDEPDWRAIDYVTTGSPSGYTIVENDLGAAVEIDGSSGITVTLPNSLPAGFHCKVVQVGAGQVTFSAAAGAVLYNRQSHNKTAGQWAVCDLYVTRNAASPTMANAEWVLSGDTTT